MNKQTFMKELKHYLNGLPQEEKQDILEDFEEHFASAASEGQSEETITDNLGSPRQIGKEMRAASHLEKADSEKSASNVFRAILSVTAIGFLNLVIVLGPALALASVVLTGWILGAVFAGSPFLVLLNAILFPATFIWFDVFFSLLVAGVGILLGIGMYYLTRLFIKGLMKYLHFNIDTIKGGLKHA